MLCRVQLPFSLCFEGIKKEERKASKLRRAGAMHTPARGVTPQLLPLRPRLQPVLHQRGSWCSVGSGLSVGKRVAPAMGGDRWPQGLPFVSFSSSHEDVGQRGGQAPPHPSTQPFVSQLKTNTKIIHERNPPAAATRLLHAGGSTGFAQRKGIRRLQNQIHVGCEKMLPRGHTPPKMPPKEGDHFSQPAAAELRLRWYLLTSGFTARFLLASLHTPPFLCAARGSPGEGRGTGSSCPTLSVGEPAFCSSGEPLGAQKPRSRCSW